MPRKTKTDKGYSTLQLVFTSSAFFAITLLWGIYNSYVPLILDAKLTGMMIPAAMVSTLTGLIMTIDNIFGVIFQPLFGRRSDRMRSRWGKRMPYLIVGMPVCAVLFALIPAVANRLDGAAGIVVMMTVIILFNFVMSTWRAPAVALMPDLVPMEYQSDGNAVVNMVSSVAGIIAAFSATLLGMFGFRDAINGGDFVSIFTFGGCLTVLALVILLTLIKWKDNRGEEKAASSGDKTAREQKESLFRLNMPREVKTSLYAMMTALFFISAASDGFNTYYTLYVTRTLGLNVSVATLLKIGGVLAAFLLAVPGGILGRRLGRNRTISIFVFGIALASTLMLLLGRFPVSARLPGLMTALFLYYGSFIMINVNTFPMMMAIGGKERFGTFGGYYYTATFLAAAVAPTFLGFFIGLFGYDVLHVFNISAMLLIFCILRMVKHGEQAADVETEKAIEKAAEQAATD